MYKEHDRNWAFVRGFLATVGVAFIAIYVAYIATVDVRQIPDGHVGVSRQGNFWGVMSLTDPVKSGDFTSARPRFLTVLPEEDFVHFEYEGEIPAGGPFFKRGSGKSVMCEGVMMMKLTAELAAKLSMKDSNMLYRSHIHLSMDSASPGTVRFNGTLDKQMLEDRLTGELRKRLGVPDLKVVLLEAKVVARSLAPKVTSRHSNAKLPEPLEFTWLNLPVRLETHLYSVIWSTVGFAILLGCMAGGMNWVFTLMVMLGTHRPKKPKPKSSNVPAPPVVSPGEPKARGESGEVATNN
jgi:hypothetical protein